MTDKVYEHVTYDYFPDRWRDLAEVQAIVYSDLDEGSAGLDTLAGNMVQLLNDTMILSNSDGSGGADDYACRRWEAILGIEPSGSATLEDRRYAIYLKFFDARPYTWSNLDELLGEVLGSEDSFLIERDVTAKTIHIRIFLESVNMMDSVEAFLDEIVPADMIMTITAYFNRYGEIEDSGKTYAQLESYTYAQMANDRSIVGL